MSKIYYLIGTFHCEEMVFFRFLKFHEIIMKRYLIKCILIFILWVSLSPFSFAIDRRKPQFLNVPSYLIVPLPWSIPGIGSGIMLTGLVGNIVETNMDIFALKVFGDAEGNIIGIDELFMMPETIYINAFYQDLSKAVVQNFEKRGMDTEKDEFNYIELDKVLSKSASVTLTLFDRRLELFGTTESQEIRIPRIRDSKGNIISEFSPSYESESRSTSYGARIDYELRGLMVRVPPFLSNKGARKSEIGAKANAGSLSKEERLILCSACR